MIERAASKLLALGRSGAGEGQRLLRELARARAAFLQEQQAAVVEPRQPVIRGQRQRARIGLASGIQLAQRLQRRAQLVEQIG